MVKQKDSSAILSEKISEIQSVQDADKVIPPGDSVEQEMEQAKIVLDTTEPITETGPAKRGRGRPKGSTKNQPADVPPDPYSNTDVIAMMVNATVVPMIATRYHKKVADVMYKPDQMAEMKKVQPPVDFLNKPNWIVYGMMAVGYFVQNFMTATKEEIKEEIKKSVKEEVTNHFNRSGPMDEITYDPNSLSNTSHGI